MDPVKPLSIVKKRAKSVSSVVKTKKRNNQQPRGSRAREGKQLKLKQQSRAKDGKQLKLKQQAKRRRSFDSGGSYKIKLNRKKVDGVGNEPEQKKWVVHSLSYCGYCTDAKKLLTEKFGPDSFISIDWTETSPSEKEKEDVLNKIDNYQYFPKIFRPDDTFLGGYDELVKELNRKGSHPHLKN